MLSYLSKAERKSWGRGLPSKSDRLCVQEGLTESGSTEGLTIKNIKIYLIFSSQHQLNCCIGNNTLEEYRQIGASHKYSYDTALNHNSQEYL